MKITKIEFKNDAGEVVGKILISGKNSKITIHQRRKLRALKVLSYHEARMQLLNDNQIYRMLKEIKSSVEYFSGRMR
jgi:hypothetical protein